MPIRIDVYKRQVLGRVTNEQKELAATIPEKKERLERLKSSMANVDAFIEKARRCLLYTSRCV